MLAGPDTFDDVGAVRQADGSVGLHSVDFFPPVVDDAEAYGAIAAANSLSDIYASGGTPSVVLNLAGFPRDWGDDILQPIFKGAVDVVMESGALWVGGHSVLAEEPLFGFSVYGSVAEEHVITNDAAKPGDLLALTKPLGAGTITTGAQRDQVSQEHVDAAVRLMRRLNDKGADAMRAAGVKSATDITGFGLLGHAGNIARASKVQMCIDSFSLPLMAGVEAYAQEGIFSGGSAKGRATLESMVTLGKNVPEWLSSVGFDAETSGGLLVCVPADRREDFAAAMPEDQPFAWVGEVREGGAQVILS
jgi:selenide,water dikinase